MTTAQVDLSEEAVLCCGGPVVVGERVTWFVTAATPPGGRPWASRHADLDHEDLHPVTGRVARIQVVSQLFHEVALAGPDHAWTRFRGRGGRGRTFVPAVGTEQHRDVVAAPVGSEAFDADPGRRQRTYRRDTHWTVDLEIDDVATGVAGHP